MRRLLVLGVLATASVAPNFAFAGVVLTQPFAGQWSNSHSVHFDQVSFIQPIGNLPLGLNGETVSTVSIYVGFTPINNNAGGVISLERYADSADALTSGSASPLQSCSFSNNAIGSGVTQDGFLNYDGTCVLDTAGYWVMRAFTAQNNWNDFKVQGQSGFYTGAPTLVFTNAGSASDNSHYVNGSAESIGAMWFQWLVTSTTTGTAILLQSSTTSVDTSWNNLINNIGTRDVCIDAEGAIAYNLCKVFAYLLAPQASTLTSFSDFWATVEHKPPFGYYALLQSAFTFSTSTSATSSSSYILAAAAGSSVIYGGFFDRWNFDLSVILYLMVGMYILIRLIYFDFHA